MFSSAAAWTQEGHSACLNTAYSSRCSCSPIDELMRIWISDARYTDIEKYRDVDDGP